MTKELQIRNKGQHGYAQINAKVAKKTYDAANLVAGAAASFRVPVAQEVALGDFVLVAPSITVPAHGLIKGEASQLAITSIAHTAGATTATATLTSHGLVDATNTTALVRLSGSADNDFNGLKTITYLTANTFTISPISEDAATSAADVKANIVTVTIQNADDATAMDLASGVYNVLVL